MKFNVGDIVITERETGVPHIVKKVNEEHEELELEWLSLCHKEELDEGNFHEDSRIIKELRDDLVLVAAPNTVYMHEAINLTTLKIEYSFDLELKELLK